MKKLFTILMIVFMSVLFGIVQVWAVDSTCTESDECYGSYCIKTLSWTDSDAHTWTAYKLTTPIRGIIWSILTDPGTTAPTDNYSVFLSRSSSVPTVAGDDVLGFACNANCDTANTETRTPLVDGNPWPRLTVGDLYLIIGSNAVNSATGTIKIQYTRK